MKYQDPFWVQATTWFIFKMESLIIEYNPPMILYSVRSSVSMICCYRLSQNPSQNRVCSGIHSSFCPSVQNNLSVYVVDRSVQAMFPLLNPPLCCVQFSQKGLSCFGSAWKKYVFFVPGAGIFYPSVIVLKNLIASVPPFSLAAASQDYCAASLRAVLVLFHIEFRVCRCTNTHAFFYRRNMFMTNIFKKPVRSAFPM